MAKEMKSLAKDTVIYGGTNIAAKFVSWMLVVLYTYTLPNPAEYGVVTNLYAWTSLLIVALTYGMETGFFRFANKDTANAKKVYGNTLISIGFTSLLFAIIILVFQQPIANTLGYRNHPEYIWMLGLSVAMDAFSCIPFVYLRFIKRPYVFAGMKLLYVGLNVVLNIFFLVLCPFLMKVAPSTISWFYLPDYGVGYIFISNIISTTIQTLILSKYIFQAEFKFDSQLLKQMLKYSYPLVFLGIAGIANQNLDKMIFPFLQVGTKGGNDLGIYGAVSKLALVIMMFTQAFRFAYEPFVFAKHKDEDSSQTYSEAMKFFVILSFLIFLGMILYMDIIKYLVPSEYWVGLKVVPIILFSFIFQGIYFNLSIWYKLKDKNHYGAWFAAIGTLIVFVGNIIFVPRYSYWGSAWSAFAGYFIVMLLSYFFGQKFMPIDYHLKKLGIYLALTLVLFGISSFIETPYLIVNLALKTVLMAVFIVFFIKKDMPLKEIPYLNRFLKK